MRPSLSPAIMTGVSLNEGHPMKAPMFKKLVLVAALAAAVVSGCADLTTGAATGGTVTAQSDINMPGNAHSPYPAATDRGIF